MSNTRIVHVVHTEDFGIERMPQDHNALSTMSDGDRLYYKLSEEICNRLRQDPRAVLEKAHTLLDRFDNPYAQKAWRELLTHPIEDIINTITELSDQGQWLRSCSPFAGILSEPERLHIIRTLRISQ